MVKHYLHNLSAPFSFRRVLLAALLLLIGTTASAYDFAVKNADGVTIYYNKLDGGGVKVTYRDYYDNSGAYEGKVNIPSSVTYGGTSYSVTSIGGSAFSRCSGLTEVTIPESVTSIKSGAFSGCDGLTEVTIPESVTSIGGSAFSRCSGLTEMTVDSNNTFYDSRENCNSIIESASNTLIFGCMNSKIPNSVTSIGGSAFSGCSGLTEITIPESVTSIGSYAFESCSGLTEVTIPKSVTSIGGYAFSSCDGLTEVTIPNSVTSIGACAFYCCSGLTEVTIPESVTSIGAGAFGDCDGLTEVNFNAKNCTKIEESDFDFGAFAGCNNLRKLTIGNNVQTIPSNAFRELSGLTEVNFNATNCTHMGNNLDPVFDGCNNLQKLTIGNNVQTIPNYAFYGCTGLTEITIPESVTYIGSHAFYNSVIGPDRGYTEETKSTQSTISTTIDTKPSVWNCNKQFYIQCDGKEYQLNGKEITIDGLAPGKNYDLYICIAINGCMTELTYFEYTTKDISISVQTSKTATSTMVTPNIAGDAVIANQYVSDGSNILPTFITGLDPNTTYTFNYIVEGEGWTRKKEFTVKTDELTMLTLPGQAMNTTTALLCAETNICDDEVNVGFEWRRHDAPSTLPSNKVACAAIDGTITGALSGLNPEVYYNYRPYYTSNSGKTYYGEWITFFTGDANVFFDPTVKTYSAEVLDDYSAVLKGYALRGSEDIASQGFQYWKSWGAPNGSRSNEVAEVEVKGQKLSCTIADLEPGSTYTYRTFVKTASGITYGEEMTFDTPGSAGIEETIAETTEVVITGYYNLQGVRSDRPFSGLNIVSYSDGTTKKVIYRK